MNELFPSNKAPRQFTLPASEIRPEAQGIAGAVHTNGQAMIGTVNEQEWHQHAARYLAMGMTQAQTADACGVGYLAVAKVCAAQWFQERVTKLMAAQDSDIMEHFKQLRIGAVLKLENLLEAKSETVQLGAIKEILDRNLGKAVQRIESDTTVRSADPVQEAKQLQEEILRLGATPVADLSTPSCEAASPNEVRKDPKDASSSIVPFSSPLSESN